MMKYLVAILVFFSGIQNGFCQNLEQMPWADDNEWGNGRVRFTDGTEQKGLLRYKDAKSVSFKVGEGIHVVASTRIVNFEYYDERQLRQRTFYSLTYEDPVSHSDANQIFEVLRQFHDFSILTKIDPLTTRSQQFRNPRSFGMNRLIVSQVETLYFLEEGHRVEPYLEITYKGGSPYDLSNGKTLIVNKDLPAHFVGSRLEQMNLYAKQKKLKMNNKEDLLDLLDYAEAKAK